MIPMPTYRVFSASIYNNQGLLNSKCINLEPESNGSNVLIVRDDPSRRVVVTGGKVIEDKTDPSGVRSILLVEVPAFPIAELTGKILVPANAVDGAEPRP